MTIHIGLTTCERGSTVRVDGWLEGDEAEELLRIVGEIEVPVVLDLTDLRSADEIGLRVLRQLAEQGVELGCMSDYLNLLMDREDDKSASKDREREEPKGAEVK